MKLESIRRVPYDGSSEGLEIIVTTDRGHRLVMNIPISEIIAADGKEQTTLIKLKTYVKSNIAPIG